jgi:DNA-binding NarL/FixJ family response regulator
MAEIRILVADDFELWRIRIREILKSRPAWQIVFEATDGVEALEKTTELHPDVVLLDIQMPRLSGIEAARKMLQVFPDLKIIFLSQSNDEYVIAAALETGAKAYLQKTRAMELIPVIEAAIRDED